MNQLLTCCTDAVLHQFMRQCTVPLSHKLKFKKSCYTLI